MLDTARPPLYHRVAEVVTVSEADRLAALQRAGLVHPRAEAVTAPLFSSGGFFLAADKVQVKYEMLRAHLAGHVPVTAAAAAHGYSRAAFYLVPPASSRPGWPGCWTSAAAAAARSSCARRSPSSSARHPLLQGR